MNSARHAMQARLREYDEKEEKIRKEEIYKKIAGHKRSNKSYSDEWNKQLGER